MEMLLHGNALLALAAAVLWGGGDFSGGMGVKHAGGSMGAALRVILLEPLCELERAGSDCVVAWGRVSARRSAGLGDWLQGRRRGSRWLVSILRCREGRWGLRRR